MIDALSAIIVALLIIAGARWALAELRSIATRRAAQRHVDCVRRIERLEAELFPHWFAAPLFRQPYRELTLSLPARAIP